MVMSTEQSKRITVIFGETGVGKSSFINYCDGSEISIEGHTLASETYYPQTYFTHKCNLHIMDTPGLLDTNGAPNNVLMEMIGAELLKYEGEIASIIVLYDGTSARIRVGDVVHELVHLFGNDVLNSIVYAVNTKGKSIDQQMIIELIESKIGDLYPSLDELRDRIVLIDTKGDFQSFERFIGPLSKCKALQVSTLMELQTKRDQCVAMEKQNPANWKIWNESIPHTSSLIVDRLVDVDVPYTEECNCHDKCTRRILRMCVRRDRVCDECMRTRKEKRLVQVSELQTSYTSLERREQINSDSYLALICKQRIWDEAFQFVFSFKQK